MSVKYRSCNSVSHVRSTHLIHSFNTFLCSIQIKFTRGSLTSSSLSSVVIMFGNNLLLCLWWFTVIRFLPVYWYYLFWQFPQHIMFSNFSEGRKFRDLEKKKRILLKNVGHKSYDISNTNIKKDADISI